jgi:hypothetical protein
MRMNGYHDPTSLAYCLRNPGMLRAFSTKHAKDENGYRIFNSFPSGYDNLCQDLVIKCSGNSHSRLRPEDTLENLVMCYGYPKLSAVYLKKFLTKALNDDTIRVTTRLGWFLEDRKEKDKKSVFVPDSQFEKQEVVCGQN